MFLRTDAGDSFLACPVAARYKSRSHLNWLEVFLFQVSPSKTPWEITEEEEPMLSFGSIPES